MNVVVSVLSSLGWRESDIKQELGAVYLVQFSVVPINLAKWLADPQKNWGS
jgi:hypothetical protein